MGSTRGSRRRGGVSRRWRRGGRSFTPPARRRGGASIVARGRRRKTPTRPEKLKRTGAVLSRQIASQRCCVRAARAFCSAIGPSSRFGALAVRSAVGRAQSNRRGARFFHVGLRSQRAKMSQACESRSGASIVAHSAPGKGLSHLCFWQGHWLAVGRPADVRTGNVTGRPLRHRYARHGSPRGEKCPLSRLVARPMTQNGRASRRTRPDGTPGGPAAAAKPRRFARAHTGTKKAARPAPRVQPRPLLPRTTRTYTRKHRGRGHKGCHHHNTKKGCLAATRWTPTRQRLKTPAPQDVDNTPGSTTHPEARSTHLDAASTTPTPEETLDELLRDAPRNAGSARARQEAAWDLQGKEDARRLLYEREVAARHAKLLAASINAFWRAEVLAQGHAQGVLPLPKETVALIGEFAEPSSKFRCDRGHQSARGRDGEARRRGWRRRRPGWRVRTPSPGRRCRKRAKSGATAA